MPPCTAPCIVSSNYNVVNHSITTVNGLSVDQYMWFDHAKLPRTLSLKREGEGNPGHGGYAVQMTYLLPSYSPSPHWYTVTVNASTTSDGGFGYFVSHERDRWFGGNTYGTIAGHIFGVDDSPLGLGAAVTEQYPTTSSGTTASAAVRFQTTYHHYGTITPVKVNPNTGVDQTPLPAAKTSYQLYSLPVTLTWVIQALKDNPRFVTRVHIGNVGGVDLVNFDIRAPYGVMVFDNGANGTVTYAAWGDEQYQFAPTTMPVTRSDDWTWNTANTGGRYSLMQAGSYEMGLYEPIDVGHSSTVDGYANERGYTSQSYASAGGTSEDSCSIETAQTLPSDGTWPYQSEQYSLPCPTANTPQAINAALTTPTSFKKLAWGTTAYYGSSLTGVYDGQESVPFDGYPASGIVEYNLCVSIAQATSGGWVKREAAAYIPGNPQKLANLCATATVTS